MCGLPQFCMTTTVNDNETVNRGKKWNLFHYVYKRRKLLHHLILCNGTKFKSRSCCPSWAGFENKYTCMVTYKDMEFHLEHKVTFFKMELSSVFPGWCGTPSFGKAVKLTGCIVNYLTVTGGCNAAPLWPPRPLVLQFFTQEQMVFFIALWNYCFDNGKLYLENDPRLWCVCSNVFHIELPQYQTMLRFHFNIPWFYCPSMHSKEFANNAHTGHQQPSKLIN